MSEPDVAVTVTEYVPAGVVLLTVLLLPPQALIPAATSVSTRIEAKAAILLRRLRNANIGSSSSDIEPVASVTAACTLLLIVMVDVEAAVPFGVTVAGLKAQVEFAGSPEQANVVAPVNPLTGVIVIVAEAGEPAVTDPLAGEIARVKSAGTAAVTVIDIAEEVEVRLPPSPPYDAVTE